MANLRIIPTLFVVFDLLSHLYVCQPIQQTVQSVGPHKISLELLLRSEIDGTNDTGNSGNVKYDEILANQTEMLQTITNQVKKLTTNVSLLGDLNKRISRIEELYSLVSTANQTNKISEIEKNVLIQNENLLKLNEEQLSHTSDLQRHEDELKTLTNAVGKLTDEISFLKNLSDHIHRVEKLYDELKSISDKSQIDEKNEATSASAEVDTTVPAVSPNCMLSGPELAQVMTVGTRVVRGKDWMYGNQDGDPPGKGTIVQPLDDRGMVYVRWDKTAYGTNINYPMSDGLYGLKLADCN